MTAIPIGTRLKNRCQYQRSQANQGDRKRCQSLAKRQQLRLEPASVNDRDGIIHESPLYRSNPAAANQVAFNFSVSRPNAQRSGETLIHRTLAGFKKSSSAVQE
jgi:hypothetical protein